MKSILCRCTLLSSLLLVTACSNIGEKRTALSAAGFQTIAATTPSQISHLRTMKPGMVVPLNGKKGTVYVFPDPSKGALMVGSPAQYQQYRAIRQKQKQTDEKLLEAQSNMDAADWNAWGPAGNWGWGVASDPL
jgi:hypothetical protein